MSNGPAAMRTVVSMFVMSMHFHFMGYKGKQVHLRKIMYKERLNTPVWISRVTKVAKRNSKGSSPAP